MRAIFKAAALFGLVVGLVAAAGIAPAPGRQKDKDGTVEVYQAKDGWRFRVKDAQGNTIAVGVVGYEKKEDAVKAVETLKGVMGKAKIDVKDEKKEKDGKKEKAKDGGTP